MSAGSQGVPWLADDPRQTTDLSTHTLRLEFVRDRRLARVKDSSVNGDAGDDGEANVTVVWDDDESPTSPATTGCG